MFIKCWPWKKIVNEWSKKLLSKTFVKNVGTKCWSKKCIGSKKVGLKSVGLQEEFGQKISSYYIINRYHYPMKIEEIPA